MLYVVCTEACRSYCREKIGVNTQLKSRLSRTVMHDSNVVAAGQSSPHALTDQEPTPHLRPDYPESCTQEGANHRVCI